jgi:hypothetical protein
MKKLRNYYLAVLAIGSLGFMTSCGDDEDVQPEERPTIEFIGGTGFTSGDRTVAAGEEIVTKVHAASGQSDTNLERFTIKVSTNGATAATLFDTTGLKGESFDYTARYFTQGVAGTSVYTYTVEDNKGRTTDKTYTITTTSANTGAAINTFTTQLFGSSTNPNPSFFATSTGTRYYRNTAPANASKIDFVYFYGSTNLATIAAPNDDSFGTGTNQISSLNVHTWSKRNATTFKTTTLSATDFNNITSDAGITTAYTAGVNTTVVSRASGLTAGKVIAFKTEAGKQGLILVQSITGTTAGTITLDVKVQK